MTQASMRRLVLVLATLCVVRGGARADDSSLHILGLAQLGFTDNLLSGPRNPPAGVAAPPVEWDTFLGLRPGVLATYGTPRAIHELTYTLDANLYVRHSELSTLFHRAQWRGFFLLGPRSELVTTVGGSFGDSNLAPATIASAGTVSVFQSGQVETLGGDAGENWSYMLDRDLRLTQDLTARYDRTNAGAAAGVQTGSELGARLGLDKSFRYDAVSATVGASYLTLSRPLGTGMNQEDRLLNARGTIMGRRDLTKGWTGVVDVGAVGVIPTNGVGKTVVLPVGGGSLAYYPAWGSASLSVRRDVNPNLLIAQNTLSDSAVAAAWLPLPWGTQDASSPEWSIQGTVGASRTQLIDSNNGTVVQGFDDLLGDVALNWNVRKNAGFSFRYQVIWQSSDLSAMGGALPVFGFVRNTVLVQFFGRWPERLAVEVPVRQTLRVDRSNITPVGEEIPGAGGAGATGGGSGNR
jgi:hypothetical protein